MTRRHPGQISRKAAIDFASSVPGWMHVDALGWIFDASRNMPPLGRWVEIGVWKGRSFSAAVLGANVGCYVHGIDTFEGSPRERADGSQNDPHAFTEFMRTYHQLKRIAPGVTTSFTRCESLVAAKHFAQTIDVLFIDGDHDDAQEDIEGWIRHVKAHGLVVGHDYGYDAVRTAVDQSFSDVRHGPDGIWSVRL